MQSIPHCTFILFYSNINPESLKTKLAASETIEKYRDALTINILEADFDHDKKLCKDFGIMGVPALLIFINQKLLGRYYGELSAEEFENIIEGVLKNPNN